jgi:hypothetical protein
MTNIPAILTPKIQNRFNVSFNRFAKSNDLDEFLSKQVVSVRLPTLERNKFYTPYSKLEIVLRDDMLNQVDDIINYNIQNDNKKHKFEVSINYVNNLGNILRTINYKNCILSNIEYSELTYKKDDACEIKLFIDGDF